MDHIFKYEIGEKLYVRDPSDIFMDNVQVVVVNRDFIADVEVYTVIDHRNWSTAYRVEKLYKGVK